MLSLDNNSLVLLVPFSVVRWCANCLVQNADIQTTPYSVETRRDFGPQGYMAEKGIEEHYSFPTVPKCHALCHWLWTRPHSNGTDNLAKAGQSAEQANESHTGNH